MIRSKILWLSALCVISAAVHAEHALMATALTKGRAAILIDGKQRTLIEGATSPEGIKLIAADATHATVEVDGRRMDLHLDQRISSGFAPKAASKALLLAPGQNGHYLVDGEINGSPVPFIVDTGATTVAMNKHTAKKIGLLYRTDGKPGQVETASGVTAAYYLTLAKVKIHSLELTNVEAVVIDGDFPSTALLGQSFLNRLDMRRNGALLELHER